MTEPHQHHGLVGHQVGGTTSESNDGESARQNSNLLDLLLLASYAACGLVFLIQAESRILQLMYYVLVGIAFVATIQVSFVANRKWVAVIGVLWFALVIRAMYFFRTDFMVLPFGDSYGQYGLLASIVQSGHLVFPIYSGPFTPLSAMKLYSQWPSFQVTSASFSLITSISPFRTSQVLPFLLYVVIFAASYLVLRSMLANMRQNVRVPLALVLSFMVTLPNSRIPVISKYDLTAAIFVLLLIYLVLNQIGGQRGLLLFTLISVGLVTTHNYTSLVWLLVLILLALMSLLAKTRKVPARIRAAMPEPRTFPYWRRLSVVLVVLNLSWFAYFGYAVWPRITFILEGGVARLLTGTLVPTVLRTVPATVTPEWAFLLLQFRNYSFLALVGTGMILLFFRPQVFRDRLSVAMILAIGAVTLLVPFLPSLGSNEFLTYQVTLFTPLICLAVVLPMALIFSKNARLGTVILVIASILFMTTSFIGYWGNNYAPVYLYSNSTAAVSIGEHPLTWPAVSTFLTHADGSHCIATNEEYVTSLSLRPSRWYEVSGVWDLNSSSNCLEVVFTNLNVSHSYIREVNSFPANFSWSKFYSTLSSENLIFNSGLNQDTADPNIFLYPSLVNH